MDIGDELSSKVGLFETKRLVAIGKKLVTFEGEMCQGCLVMVWTDFASHVDKLASACMDRARKFQAEAQGEPATSKDHHEFWKEVSNMQTPVKHTSWQGALNAVAEILPGMQNTAALGAYLIAVQKVTQRTFDNPSHVMHLVEGVKGLATCVGTSSSGESNSVKLVHEAMKHTRAKFCSDLKLHFVWKNCAEFGPEIQKLEQQLVLLQALLEAEYRLVSYVEEIGSALVVT